jgi:hypothetical protein
MIKMYPTIGTFSTLRITSLINLILLASTACSGEGYRFFLIEREPIYCPKSFKNKKDIVLANTLKTDGIKWTHRVLDWTQRVSRRDQGYHNSSLFEMGLVRLIYIQGSWSVC